MKFRLWIPLISILPAASFLACGGGEDMEAQSEGAVAVSDTLVLAVRDTIGLEMGDSSYVFGMIMEAGHGLDGEITVLDMQRSCLSVYSPDGLFLRNIGTPGPGPGEFQIPVNFAVMTDGGYAVADAIGRNISFFSPEGEYLRMMSGFFPTPPMSIQGGPDGSLVGESMAMMLMGQDVTASVDICRWSDSAEADVVYLSVPMELNIQEGGGATTVERNPEIDFAVGPDGSVFVAELSDTLFSVRGFSPEGEEILTMVEETERTPMTQDELDAGSLSLSIRIIDGEASSNMDRVEDVYPWRNVIASIGVDAESRIWVEMANEDHPVFRVYDYSGNLLFYAVTDVPFTPVSRPSFMIDAGGFLACDRDPLDYPKIFSFTLAERP
ncbi:MAG: hypothetical protein JXA64_10270 [Candidatus Fermentibacteraceae bacterium]|nr:hypothetical protein [Candidatus Fermentibacteraceae bacterium]